MEANAIRSATAYLEDLGRLLTRVEATGPGGGALAVDEAVSAVVDLLVGLGRNGGKAMLVGNGGSAAIVSHMQNDLFKMVGLRALVFTEQPLLTALANDDGYETAFRQCVDRWAAPGDVLFAVSSSGNSANITSAVAAAEARGCRTVTFSGFRPDNRLRQMGDVRFYVPADAYGSVELTHAILGHCISDFAAARVGWSPAR